MEQKTEGRRLKFTRRRFISLGTALGAGAALVACGGGTTSSTSSSDSGEASGGGASGDAIAAESDVAAGDALEFEDNGDPAALVRLDGGDFVAYSAICTHQSCTVAYRDAQLVCPCHGSVFDPADGGAVVTGPATRPLPEIPVEVVNGEVVRA